jgi:predicted nucleic acid-binding protein
MTDDGFVFVDTNILVYAYDRDAGSKRQVARDLLAQLWIERRGVLSTQVLQELYVTVTRKLQRPMPRMAARRLIGLYGRWQVREIRVADLRLASEIEENYQLSFWDGLIVAAATSLGARRVASEDMQHGQQIGSVRIVNPFVAARP